MVHASSVRKIMSLFSKAEFFGFKMPVVIRPFLLKEIPSVCVGKISCFLCVNSQIAEPLTLCLISFEKAYFFRLNSSISIVNVVQNIITL